MDIKFADTAENKRDPNPTEQLNGYPCGPADQALFNQQMFVLYKEMHEVLVHAGLSPSTGDLTQLRQAIQAMIDATIPPVDTGGDIDTSLFVLMNQARVRLPIYPEIQTSDGKMVVTSTGAGNVRVPAGVNFQHRGIFPVVSVQTDFGTAANKTYHLRWTPVDGFVLKDLANAGYNPTALAEYNRAFDSAYDSMLVATITTNGSNIPTITNLVNKNRLFAEQVYESNVGEILEWTTGNEFGGAALYWSRTPIVAQPMLQFIRSFDSAPAVGLVVPSSQGSIMSIGVRPRSDANSITRYGALAPQITYQDSARNNGRYRFTWIFVAE